MTKHILTLTVLSALFFFCSTSCSNDLPDVEQFDIKKDFSIEMREELTTNGNSLSFVITTKENQSCLNDTITNTYLISSNRIEIALNDIAHEGDCDMGFAPAQVVIPIGDLALRTYNMNINLRGDIVSLGALHVEGDRYRLVMEEEKGFEIPRKTLFRIPTFAIWGYVEYTDETSRQIAENFVLDLNEIANSREYPEGFYGWFEIDSSNNFNHLNLPNSDLFISFIMEYEANQMPLNDLLETYRQNTDISIQLRTWDGRDL